MPGAMLTAEWAGWAEWKEWTCNSIRGLAPPAAGGPPKPRYPRGPKPRFGGAFCFGMARAARRQGLDAITHCLLASRASRWGASENTRQPNQIAARGFS